MINSYGRTVSSHCGRKLILPPNSPPLSPTILSRGEEVIVSMDANDSIDGNSNGLTSMVVTTGLVNIMNHRHDGNPTQTYVRGSNRFDCHFGSSDLLPNVQTCGHIGIQDGITSHHSGQWIEFDSVELFRGPTTSISSPTARPFSIGQRKVNKFIVAMEKYMEESKIES